MLERVPGLHKLIWMWVAQSQWLALSRIHSPFSSHRFFSVELRASQSHRDVCFAPGAVNEYSQHITLLCHHAAHALKTWRGTSWIEPLWSDMVVKCGSRCETPVVRSASSQTLQQQLALPASGELTLFTDYLQASFMIPRQHPARGAMGRSSGLFGWMLESSPRCSSTYGSSSQQDGGLVVATTD
jgi:hypothetical protein